MSSVADFISWLKSPATILALVPFLKFGIEFGFRRLFKKSTEHALALAAQDERNQPPAPAAGGHVPDPAEEAKAKEREEYAREDAAVYVDNWASLEKVYQVIAFSALSLFMWMVLESKPGGFQLASALLWAFIVILSLYVGIKVMQGKVDMASIKATRNFRIMGYVLDFSILLFEFVSKQVELMSAGAAHHT